MTNFKSFNIHILVILSLFITKISLAQNQNSSCSNTLIQADKDYEAGRFSMSIEKLNACINSFNSSELFEAYRLLALCYINTNEEKKATDAAIKLLKYKPDYKDFPYFDPIEFTRLLSKYDVWPNLELGIKTGLNMNSINVLKNYSITNSDATYLPNIGFQAGVFAEYYLKKKISVNFELLFEGLNYTRTTLNLAGWKQEFNEKITFFTIPITAKYYYSNWKGYNFSGEIGLQYQLLNETNSNILLTNSSTNETVQNTLIQKSQRNNSLFYALAGLAIKHKLGGGILSLNMRYGYGLNNIVKTENRYENIDFIISNQYVDSDISFNPFYISFGYQFPIPNMCAVKKINKP